MTSAGIVVELAVERHWSQPSQQVAWVAVMLSAVYGIWEHVDSNYDAGELDYRYADTWGSVPETTRWWLAVSKTVGPSPPLAPGALAQASLCVLLATLRHPSLRNVRDLPSVTTRSASPG